MRAHGHVVVAHMLEVKSGCEPSGKSPFSPSAILGGGSCDPCNLNLGSLLGIQIHNGIILRSGADPQTWSDIACNLSSGITGKRHVALHRHLIAAQDKTTLFTERNLHHPGQKLKCDLRHCCCCCLSNIVVDGGQLSNVSPNDADASGAETSQNCHQLACRPTPDLSSSRGRSKCCTIMSVLDKFQGIEEQAHQNQEHQCRSSRRQLHRRPFAQSDPRWRPHQASRCQSP